VQCVFKATGELVPGGTLTFPVVLDRGVYKTGQTYQAGDGVTWAGSFWIAQRETSEKPGEGPTGWRLAVKAGREGKQGIKGDPGDRGPKGDQGPQGRSGY
jgi:integrin beta 3